MVPFLMENPVDCLNSGKRLKASILTNTGLSIAGPVLPAFAAFGYISEGQTFVGVV